MRIATDILVRTVPEPPRSSTASVASPEQWTLPLDRRAELTVRASTEPCPLGANATLFVQALVEVLAGNRPIAQMSAWMSADVYDQLVQRLTVHTAARSARKRPAARAASVHVAMIADETAEIAARMVQSGRSRAIAIRLERQTSPRGRRQWRCTALTWG